MLDLIIIGYGPGSQQLIVNLLDKCQKYKKILNYKIIESGNIPGISFSKYPVHKELISNNKLYTGKDPKSEYSERFDWNSIITQDKDILLRNYSKDFYPKSYTILEMMRDIHNKYDINTNFNETCIKIENNNGIFNVKTNLNDYTSKYVVIATGYKPKVLKNSDIEGIEYCTSYSNIKNKEYYRDKSVFIIGKGNSGFECAKDIMNEANMILIASPSSTKLAYQTHYVGNVRLINSVPIENYQLKSLSAVLDCKILKIEKVDNKLKVKVEYEHAQNEVEEIIVDEIIVANGFQPNIPIIEPNIEYFENNFPSINGEFESSNIKNLYFAGAITHGLDYKQYSSSGFIHGFRYNSICLSNILFKNMFNVEDDEIIYMNNLKNKIFETLNNNPGIYLQPGFLGVNIIINDSGIKYKGYLSKKAFEDRIVIKEIQILLTLEYGDINTVTDHLSIDRFPGDPNKSLHIHPVIRLKGDINKTYVLEENLFNKFDFKLNDDIVNKLLLDIKEVI